MADFTQFEGEEIKQTEEDPAAEFLAREQNELAGLEDDNFGVDTGTKQIQDDMDPLAEPAGSQDMWGGDTEKPAVSDPSDLTNGPSDTYSAISFQDRERAVPEKILAWRAEQEIQLGKKDAEEEEKKLEWAEAAKKELDDWYKHHTEQLEKTKDNNRAAEEVFVKERDETEPGGEWEKICRLCEFNPKNSKNVKDVSRMRSILLQLKQTPLVR
ncbi:hypothetical protein ScPMuIL_009105 [Solemya velum]